MLVLAEESFNGIWPNMEQMFLALIGKAELVYLFISAEDIQFKGLRSNDLINPLQMLTPFDSKTPNKEKELKV